MKVEEEVGMVCQVVGLIDPSSVGVVLPED